MALYRPTEKGLHDAWRDVNDVHPTALSGIGKGFPGMAWTWQGNIYQYVRNRHGAAITEGQAVAISYGSASRLSTLTAASTKARIVTNDTFEEVGGLVGVHEWPGYVFSTAGTTIGERRQILANSIAAAASTIDVAVFNREAGPVGGLATTHVDAYATLPDGTTTTSVFCPWEVVLADIDALVTARLQGVVVSTSITDDYMGVIQITGPAIALVDGTTDLVAGDALIPSATAGDLAKSVNATPTAAEVFNLYLSGAFVLDAYITNSAGRRHVVLNGRHAVYPFPVTIS